MKTIYVLAILALVLVVGALLYVSRPTQAKSTLIIAVKDIPRKTEFGNITSLILTFSEVSVHKALGEEEINTSTEEINVTESNDTEDSGWFVVVNETQTVDLLLFTDVEKILGEKTLDAGKYTQIRLRIISGTITIDNVTYNLTIPSRVLKLNRGFVLEPDTTVKLTLDFKAEKSVVKTGSDTFKLKPVIAVISEKLY